MSPADIVITGIGMRSSVGNCAAQTCASVRAGINRFGAWDWFAPTDNGEGDGPSGVTAAACRPDLGDEAWSTKAIDLLMEPLHEAVWQAKLFEETSQKPNGIRLYVSTPYQDRNLSESEEEEPELDVDTDTPDEEGPTKPREKGIVSDYRSFIQELEELLDETIRVDDTLYFPHDHAGGGAALAGAMADLRSGKAARAILLGVDSLLHTPHLEYLLGAGFLKTDLQATGLIPGEAAGVVVLESHAAATRRQAKPLASVRSVELAMERYRIGEDAPVTGESLSNVLRAAVDGAGGPKQFQQIMIDLNGQRARFLEWATVETRCMHAFPRGWKLNHPADCLGDIGAAFVPMALGLLARSYERDYGVGPTALCCSSLRGERTAVTVFPILST
jgi:3-oxoacyl-[acyl-carrier-protein] synthase-1